jgi:hypothetical protein
MLVLTPLMARAHSLLVLSAELTLWNELGSSQDGQGGRLTHATQILAVHIDQIVTGLDAAVAGERAAPRQAAHHQAVHAPLLNVHLKGQGFVDPDPHESAFI